MRTFIGLAALALTLSLAACGGSSGGGGGDGTVTYACTLSAEHACFEWKVPSGSTAGAQAAFASACTTNGGSASSACGTSSLAGKCTLTQSAGGFTYTIVNFFYTSGWTTSEVQSGCTSEGGTFSGP